MRALFGSGLVVAAVMAAGAAWAQSPAKVAGASFGLPISCPLGFYMVPEGGFPIAIAMPKKPYMLLSTQLTNGRAQCLYVEDRVIDNPHNLSTDMNGFNCRPLQPSNWHPVPGSATASCDSGKPCSVSCN